MLTAISMLTCSAMSMLIGAVVALLAQELRKERAAEAIDGPPGRHRAIDHDRAALEHMQAQTSVIETVAIPPAAEWADMRERVDPYLPGRERVADVLRTPTDERVRIGGHVAPPEPEPVVETEETTPLPVAGRTTPAVDEPEPAGREHPLAVAWAADPEGFEQILGALRLTNRGAA